jgi:hypothetical protein
MLNWLLYKIWLKPVYRVTIQFKNGKKYKGFFSEMKVLGSGDSLNKLTWTQFNGKILYIDLNDVQLIISKKYNWTI